MALSLFAAVHRAIAAVVVDTSHPTTLSVTLAAFIDYSLRLLLSNHLAGNRNGITGDRSVSTMGSRLGFLDASHRAHYTFHQTPRPRFATCPIVVARAM